MARRESFRCLHYISKPRNGGRGVFRISKDILEEEGDGTPLEWAEERIQGSINARINARSEIRATFFALSPPPFARRGEEKGRGEGHLGAGSNGAELRL